MSTTKEPPVKKPPPLAQAAKTFSEKWVKAAAKSDDQTGCYSVISAGWMENGTLLIIARGKRADALSDLLVERGLAIPDHPFRRPA